jgi:hypothetical protein
MSSQCTSSQYNFFPSQHWYCVCWVSCSLPGPTHCGCHLLLCMHRQVALAVSLSSRLRSNPVLEYDLYAGGPRPPLMIQGAQLVRRSDGKAVQLNGVNW